MSVSPVHSTPIPGMSLNPITISLMARTMTFALAVMIAVTLTAGNAQAQSPTGNFGIGGQIGDPSGLTVKMYQRSGFAYELLAAWDLDNFFFLNGHALYERPITNSPIRYYLGPGALIGIHERRPNGNDFVVGISGQLGLNYFVDQFEVFLHITPRLNVIPNTDGDIGGGIGLRFYP